MTEKKVYRQTDIVTEKAKTIYPYILRTGGIKNDIRQVTQCTIAILQTSGHSFVNKKDGKCSKILNSSCLISTVLPAKSDGDFMFC